MVKEMKPMGSGSRSLAQLALAALIMVALIAVARPHSSPEPREPGQASLHRPLDDGAARRIEALFDGVPQRGAALGDPGAPVTLQFFADLECEEARQFVIGALPLLVRSWVRKGDLRIVYRANLEETEWPDVFNRQQVATLAAGAQGKAWNFLDFFYHEQGPEFTRYATDHFLQAIAAQVQGLDIARWTKDRGDRDLTRAVTRDRVFARRHSIGYTPAFLIGPTGGAPQPLLHFSLIETVAFDDAIEAILKA